MEGTSDIHTANAMEAPRPRDQGVFEITLEGSEGHVGTMGTAANPSGFEGVEEIETRSYPNGNSSAAGAVANFLNSIVGAGIIGLPFALQQVRV